jgi:hypothetical protein
MKEIIPKNRATVQVRFLTHHPSRNISIKQNVKSLESITKYYNKLVKLYRLELIWIGFLSLVRRMCAVRGIA